MKKFILKLLKSLISNFFLSILRLLSFIWYLKANISATDKTKVSVINTFDKGGGAAKVAFDLSKSLIKCYHISLYVANKKTSFQWIKQIEHKKYNFLELLLKDEAKNSGWIEFAGFRGLTLLKDAFFIQSSIIHIHNLHGEFLSPFIYKSLFKNKRVIWTLHDESILTGHCGFTLTCDKWKNGCGNCPDLKIFPPVNYDNTKLVLKYKQKFINELHPIIVCPSKWLADSVQQIYPKLKRVEVIPNGIDLSIFYPREKRNVRIELGLPLGKKIILYVAEYSTQNPFKGGEIIRDIIGDPSFLDHLFITIGGQKETDFYNHINYPYISDDIELAKLYAACDVLLYPTQADNLPLVILESMACGTPVISSRLGGIPEILDESNGFLIDNYRNKEAFKIGLNSYLDLSKNENENLIENAISTIQNRFTLEQMVSSYESVYFS